jgi:hypothetical protein
MKTFVLLIIWCFACGPLCAQSKTEYRENGYQLTFVNEDASLDTSLMTKMVHTFFDVYPKLAAEYNRNTLKHVTMVIDTAYKGVAETDNGKVTISSLWMHKHPADIDVITHEVMHIVQDYGESSGPGWLTEGIADYARYAFGVNNVAANWKLSGYHAGQQYTDSYRTTASFLLWIEKQVKAGTVKQLNKELRKHTYTEASWKNITGETLDNLWKRYAAS